MGTMTWHPKWWNHEQHGSAWERAKMALKRDWEQTKNDFGVKGTKDLHQNVGDTVKQAAGKEAVPPNAGTWDDAEEPLAYGFGARDQYKDHTAWNDRLETTLKSEWEQGHSGGKRGWNDVKHFVRRGFEHERS